MDSEEKSVHKDDDLMIAMDKEVVEDFVTTQPETEPTLNLSDELGNEFVVQPTIDAQSPGENPDSRNVEHNVSDVVEVEDLD